MSWWSKPNIWYLLADVAIGRRADIGSLADGFVAPSQSSPETFAMRFAVARRPKTHDCCTGDFSLIFRTF